MNWKGLLQGCKVLGMAILGVAEKQYESKQSFEHTAPFSYLESATPNSQLSEVPAFRYQAIAW
jgi:hypothetical protein